MLTEKDASTDVKLDQHFMLLDRLNAKIDAINLGPSAVSTQLARHEGWIKKLAEKAGVALEY